MLRKLNINPTQVFSYVLFGLSFVILLMAFLLTRNVDVLQNLKLTNPPGEIHAGQTVIVTTSFVKVRDVVGESTRYIECQTKDGIPIRYIVNTAKANRPIGKGGTGIQVEIPNSIPNVPTKCHFSISVEYHVYPWRTVNETANSPDFTLLP